MMRLRQIVRAALPAVLLAIFAVAPSLHAAKPHHVEHKAHSHAVSRHHVVRHRVSHRVRTRRVRYRRVYHRRYFRYRVPMRPSHDRIEQIQRALARSGFYQGQPTGRWDSDTIEAMKEFQQAHNLPPTGKIDATSLQQLGLGSNIAGLAPPRPLIAAAGHSGPGE